MGTLTVEARPGRRQGPGEGPEWSEERELQERQAAGDWRPPGWRLRALLTQGFSGLSTGIGQPQSVGSGLPESDSTAEKWQGTAGEWWWGLSCFPPSVPILCPLFKV